MLRKPSAAVLFGALALSSLFAAPAAQAATYTSTGERCTIVGTAHADTLTGTAGRDVICGLGGNDVISGRGGNDLVDGGAGADRVTGGAGSDVLRGGDGSDRLAGGDGRDLLAGGAGPDAVSGGASGDTLTGGGGGDDLHGNGGNDDLTGGAGADDLDGDAGTNWCTVGATDTQTACKYDTEKPDSDHARLSDDRVNVTEQNRYVTVRVHVVDDTGVREVRGGAGGTASGYLTDGTVRDGWWELTYVVPRWSAEGSFPLTIALRDRVGRRSERTYGGQVLTVVDDNPDLDLPRVTLVTPTPDATYDVRTSGQDVVVKARIRDAVSGVWYADLCLDKPADGYYSGLPCVPADLVSGDEHDGVWRAVVRIPKGETGGDWNASVQTVDWAHKDDSPVQWVGPDHYRALLDTGQDPADPWVQPFPNGDGRFSVTGRTDSTAPSLVSFSMTPDHVDTLSGPATVTFSIHAKDAATEGVTAVGLGLAPVHDPDNDLFGTIDLQLDTASGTDTDGTWTGTLKLPQGSPEETYTVQAWVQDVRHFRSYVSASSPYAGDYDQQILDGDPQLVVGNGG